MGNRKQFVAAVRGEITARYPWATDAAKLERFMAAVVKTLTTECNAVSLDGEAFRAAWRHVGGKGRPTYKALRALPGGEG